MKSLIKRPISTENCLSVLKQVVLIVKMVIILDGLYSGTLLYIPSSPDRQPGLPPLSQTQQNQNLWDRLC